jgi:hypothetical protein
MRDAETKGGLESGCTHKESFHKTSTDSLGMGVKGDAITGPQKPTGNPAKKAPRGHTLK